MSPIWYPLYSILDSEENIELKSIIEGKSDKTYSEIHEIIQKEHVAFNNDMNLDIVIN